MKRFAIILCVLGVVGCVFFGAYEQDNQPHLDAATLAVVH